MGGSSEKQVVGQAFFASFGMTFGSKIDEYFSNW